MNNNMSHSLNYVASHREEKGVCLCWCLCFRIKFGRFLDGVSNVFLFPHILLKWNDGCRPVGPRNREPRDCRGIIQIVVTDTDCAFVNGVWDSHEAWISWQKTTFSFLVFFSLVPDCSKRSKCTAHDSEVLILVCYDNTRFLFALFFSFEYTVYK